MIEERIVDRFRTAVADEPPLGFDPDDVVSEAARRYGRRRAVAGSAMATGGVAVAVTAVLATGGTGQGGYVGPAQPPNGSCTPSPAPATDTTGGTVCGGGGLAPASGLTVRTRRPTVPTTTVVPPGSEKPSVPQPPTQGSFPGSDAALAHLRQMIPQVLAERVPGLTFTVPDGGDLMVHPTGRLIGGAYRASGTRHRYVQVSVSHDGNALDPGADPASTGGWGSPQGESTRPDGSLLRVYAHTEGEAQNLSVLHLRTDGVIVHVDTTAKPEPGRTGLAVSQEVLTAIATDPRLTF
ncbi:MAG TPA: hypothetical protein VFV67_25700 [Actinophytocola sp.]|uniref:hypothetical protein n=1 Tax=Actinophytocola sp. TaxID=1872138 RepID=UPI002DB5B02A|nr:hypothetical protein [Actinophytocola sp.]HEU5474054.1 hypothetical protein [Actinophytocola sp.]